MVQFVGFRRLILRRLKSPPCHRVIAPLLSFIPTNTAPAHSEHRRNDAMRAFPASAVLLALSGSCSLSEAWTTSPSPIAAVGPSSRIRLRPASVAASPLSMGSRGAAKWAKKKAWLEKRGVIEATAEDEVGEDGVGGGDGFVTIVGGGRIGGLLSGGGPNLLLGRDDTIPPDGEGTPIFVATRNDALEGIVESCPENRRKDLVLLSVRTAKGADPVDGVTSVNPEGLTAAAGVHASAFKDRLAALDLKCNVVDPGEYRPAMFEKLM